MELRNTKKSYFIKYTLVFILVILSVYGCFFYFGKSFIESLTTNNGDGLIQHYTALCYYAKYLREIVKTLLFEHKLVIPEWSFSIGYGSDILTTLHYYVIGDPFNILSVLVPLRFMPYYYSFMILFRLYCAGAAFSAYGLKTMHWRQQKTDRHYAVLAGALVYVFGLYGMTAGISHPYFINPMIYLPLLLLGVEEILHKENSFLFMCVVAVSACSNFYFFYMLVVFTVLYVLLRLIFKYGCCRWKDILHYILQIGIRAVIGLGAGMLVFLPVMNAVLRDSRFGNTNVFSLIYPKKYYTQLLAGFISGKKPGYWCLMGFASVALVAVCILFIQKGKRELKTAFVCLTVFLLIPVVNCALNGFSYAASRWVWAYAFVVAFIVTEMWTELIRLDKRRIGQLGIVLTTYFLLCFWLDNSRTVNAAFALCFAFAILYLGQIEVNRIWKERLILLLIAINIGVNGHYLFSYKESKTLEKYGDWDKVNTLVMDTFDRAVAEADKTHLAEDAEFFRFSQDIINNNATLLSGLHSTQYYWTLSNPAIIESNAELGINGFTHNIYYDLNSRTRLTALANVKYYAADNGKAIQYAPYGFEDLGSYQTGTGKYQIFHNNYMLPFGYTYDSVLETEEFASLSPVEKEEAMFCSAYVEDDNVKLGKKKIDLQTVEIPYEIAETREHLTIQDHAFITTKDGVSVVLNVEGAADCETFLRIEGLTYKGCSPIELYQEDSVFDPQNLYTQEKWNAMSLLEQKKELYKQRNWTEESMMYLSVNSTDEQGTSVTSGFWLLTPNYTWYAGKEDYIVNLHYSETGKTSIEIVFPYAGIYSYDDIIVECLPKEGYEDGIQRLKEEHLENVVFDTDYISGDIQVSQSKLLCLTVPYTAGWKAYVDGVQTELYKTNYMYSGIILEKGSHEIIMEYETPGLRIGMVISLLSVLVMFGWTIWEYKASVRI